MPAEQTMDFTADYLQAIHAAQNWFDTAGPAPDTSLEDHLYATWYTKLQCDKPDAPQPAPLLVNALSAVTRMESRWQTGWTCHRRASPAYIEAAKDHQRRYLCTAEYINRDCPGRAAVAGDALQVMAHSVSDNLLDGYWIMNSAPWEQSSGRMLRVYWNINSDGATALAGTLARTLPGDMAYSLKLPLDVGGYLRPDAAVLYFYTRDLAVAMPAIQQASRELGQRLYTGTPPLTKPVATGIGLAEEPPTENQSFGTSRCRILAAALQQARTNGLQQDSDILEAIHGELLGAGIDPAKPYKTSRDPRQGTRHECTAAARLP